MPAARVILAVAVCLTSLQATAFAAESSLEVKNLKISFLADNQVRVQGVLRCNNMQPAGMQNPGSSIDVNIDFPRSQGFALLPEYFIGHYITHADRADSNPYYAYEGKEFRIGQNKVVFYNGTHILRPPVIDIGLDTYRDEGRWIGFDKTLSFTNLGDTDKLRYRVVIGWKHDHIRGRGDTGDKYFAHNYYWVVYGSFPWEEAPVCDKTLTAKFRQPVSFTERGIQVKRPVKTLSSGVSDNRQDDGQSGEVPKRKELVHQSTRPSQLEAMNASNQLEQKLTASSGVQTAGVHVTPRSASISIGTTEGVKAEVLTQLVASASVEAAYALPWIGTMEITVRGGGGNSTVTVGFDAVKKYVAGEITRAEFYEMWSVQGTGLVVPSRN